MSEEEIVNMTKEEQYKHLMHLEIETTKMRHAIFTALVSISFILPGLALKNGPTTMLWPDFELTVSQSVFLLGFIFYLFSCFHYWWYHRYSHLYRNALKLLEKDLKINVYSLRERPTIGSMKLHFDRALVIIGLVYGVITASYVGWSFFLAIIISMIVVYFLLLVNTFGQSNEPLEPDSETLTKQIKK